MPFWPRRTSHHERDALTLYYASDIHGSDLLWRKFLGAGKFYGADPLVMGGDLIGKAVVPIARKPAGGYHARFLGEERDPPDEDALQKLIAAIRFNGFYPWVASEDEISAHTADEHAQKELFERIVAEDVRRWVALADEKAQANGSSQIYVIPGNDDPWFIDDILAKSAALVMCDDRVVRVGEHELLSLAYANPTPWKSPRELSETELYERIKKLADQLEAPHRAIFNLHVPPFDSGLDRAVKINDDLTPAYEGGRPLEVPVGSTAVRQILEEYQPVLSLHGHIHESRGEIQIGRTLAINSGSEYNSGRIHGVTVTLSSDAVARRQFVIG